MKKNTHPKYNKEIEAKCACGAVFIVSSTLMTINNEICSKCHPFYTGNDKIMDTAGRVDRFKKRQAKKVPSKNK